jgi:proteasome lid subunit RPN8/RPN11
MKPAQHAWFEQNGAGQITRWRVKHRNCPWNTVADYHTHPGPYTSASAYPSPADVKTWLKTKYSFHMIGFQRPNGAIAIAFWIKTPEGFKLFNTDNVEQY